MTGEMQDGNVLARRWTLILAVAVGFADRPKGFHHGRSASRSGVAAPVVRVWASVASADPEPWT